jgi:hypothetical protein
MTGKRATWALAVVAIALLGTWIARNTYWADFKVPMPPKGEALVNPFYATQRFAERLGARTSWDRALGATPRADAVIVLSGWHWSIGRARRAALQQWVESGGRLVVDDNLIDPNGEFEDWSGIVQTYPEVDEDAAKNPGRRPPEEPHCRQAHEQRGGQAIGTGAIVMCDLGISWLESKRPSAWALRDKQHVQAMRVAIGRGSVTVINSAPFRYRKLFDGDHGHLFVAAAQLRRGDEVHFMSEDDYPGLLTLMWRRGAPVVALGLALVGFLLWRGAVRFGPLAPAPASARRSLADQIRGSGRFALQHGGQALHAAVVRALDEAARRRISHYASLQPGERSAALARVTGFDRDALSAAVYLPRLRTAVELHRTLALLEAARREIQKRHAPR